MNLRRLRDNENLFIKYKSGKIFIIGENAETNFLVSFNFYSNKEYIMNIV